MPSLSVPVIALACLWSMSNLPGGRTDCHFGFETVSLCDWTPWSGYNCSACCDGHQSQTTRTRGVCCGNNLDQDKCMFTCGIQEAKKEAADCSVCSCSAAGRIEICYHDDDDVTSCSDDCQGYGASWGQCVRDCSVHSADSLCRILNVSLFVLGVITGALTIALISLVNKRRATERSVSPDNYEDDTEDDGSNYDTDSRGNASLKVLGAMGTRKTGRRKFVEREAITASAMWI